MYKNAYWKALLGTNAEVLVTKAGIEYTVHADYFTFVSSAAEGEFGAFANTAAKLLIPGNAAVADNVEFFWAVKRDSQVEKSSPITINSVKQTKIAYVAPVKQVTTVTQTGTITAGDVYAVRIMETTPGHQPFPTWYYEVTARAGETLAACITRLVALINDTASVANKDRDLIVTAAVATTDDFTLTAQEYGVSFRVQTIFTSTTCFSSIAYTTAMKLGSGSSAQVRQLQDHGDVYKGVTTNYPNQGANPADFGKPTDLIVDADTFTIYTFTGYRSEASRTPHNVWQKQHNIILCVAITSATNPLAEIDAIIA
jgi:hypothetical protein